MTGQKKTAAVDWEVYHTLPLLELIPTVTGKALRVLVYARRCLAEYKYHKQQWYTTIPRYVYTCPEQICVHTARLLLLIHPHLARRQNLARENRPRRKKHTLSHTQT